MMDYSSESAFIKSLNERDDEQPQSRRLTDEQRKEVYNKLLAQRQGMSGAESGALIGGIGQGLAQMAAAGSDVDTSSVGQGAREMGRAQDADRQAQMDRWRQLLGEDRRDKQAELTQQNTEFNQGISREQQNRLARAQKLSEEQQAFNRDITKQQQTRLDQSTDSTLATQALNRRIAREQEDRLQAAQAWARDPANPANQAKSNKLAEEDKTQINTLARSAANKTAIYNQLQAAGDKFDQAVNAGNTDLAVTLGRQMLKTLNSTEGADAVGAEEAKRLGGLLEYKIGNIFEPGSFVGRDLDMFGEQIRETGAGIKTAIDANRQEIDRLRGRVPSQKTPKTQQVMYNGKLYNVDENGNMTEATP